MRYQLLGCAFALATAAANAITTQQWCGDQGICFQVNVPSNGKDLFLQISGPSSMSWIGLGQGSLMMGSNIFVVYSNSADTNVTLSTRLGTGHTPPQASSNTQATLLDGSMIIGDKMVANVKCSNCQSWSGGTMDFTSASTNWMYAYKSGSAIQSDSVSASISRHDGTGQFQFDLAKATAGDGTVNPFSGSATTNSSLSSAGGSGNSSTSPTGNNNNANGTASDSPSSGADSAISASTKAHGWMAAATFVLVFPTGSIIIRILPFKNVLWFHVGLQMIGYLTSLAVLETGVYIAVKNEEFMNAHPILGLIVICGLFIQPFLGLGHHILYKRQGGPNVLTIPHIWWGRILITLGIINGGLGLQIVPEGIVISVAYGIVASVVWATWMGLNLLSYMRSKNQLKRPMNKKAIRRADNNDSREITPYYKI